MPRTTGSIIPYDVPGLEHLVPVMRFARSKRRVYIYRKCARKYCKKLNQDCGPTNAKAFWFTQKRIQGTRHIVVILYQPLARESIISSMLPTTVSF